MSQIQSDDVIIDLEAACQQELGRLPTQGAESHLIDPTDSVFLQGPHLNPRCNTAQRELLMNQFVVE
ncbi:MAG: hypothetical protein Tsb009_13330 [Planctomycetaceae bacterium]